MSEDIQKNMKILFITNLPSPYRVNFFNELGKKCCLTVLYECRKDESRDDKWIAEKDTNYEAIYLKGIKIQKAQGINFEVIKYLKRNIYDVIVISGYTSITSIIAIEYLKIKKIPFVLSSDGGLIKEDKKLVYLFKKHLISTAKYYLSTGVTTTNYLIHYGAAYNRIKVYPFTSVFERDIIARPYTFEEKKVVRKELGIKESNILISVGQFIPRKGYDLFLESLQSVTLDDDIGIYIIGGIPTKEYLDLIDEKNIKQIHFLEFQSKEVLKEYYKASDLFFLPTREDIWGLVVNEALANGLPVVTTKNCVSGVEMIKNNMNGYLFEECNRNFVEKTIMLLKDKNELLKFSRNGLEVVREYTFEKMAKEHISIFERIQNDF